MIHFNMRVISTLMIGLALSLGALGNKSIYKRIFARPLRVIPGTLQVASGNGCAESQPWPCKTAGVCLSFDNICDGHPDCPDSYDEDANLCTAKNRPALDMLTNFISTYRDWLVPTYLGEGSNKQLAVHLIESKTINDYKKSMKLTEEEDENLFNLMEAVKDGRQIEMIMEGMPPSAWNELYSLFGRIVSSGFLETE